MELRGTWVERSGVPSGRHRIPTDRERTSIALPRTPIGRAGVPCRSAWTAIVAQGFAFQRARVARLAQRPLSRTTASGAEHESAWRDLYNGTALSGDVTMPARIPTPCPTKEGI